MAEPLCCTCAVSPASIDPYVVRLWLMGLSEHEVAARVAEAEGFDEPAALPFVARDIADTFRVLDVTEPFLLDPGPSVLLDGGCPVVAIQTGDIYELVQMYFSLAVGGGSSCLRALLGRPLTAKLRKDLDDVAEESGVRVREAWRAFDVLRAVYNHMEELNVDATVVAADLESHFRLKRPLAWSLTCALAIMRWRLNVANDAATRRRGVTAWSAEVLFDAASIILCGWSAAGGAAPAGCPGYHLRPGHVYVAGGGGGDQVMPRPAPRPSVGLALDPQLLLALHELTARLLRTRSDRADAVALLAPKFAAALTAAGGGGSDAGATAARKALPALPKLLGGLASLAQRLSSSEFRDFFEDLVVGVIEPLGEAGVRTDARARQALLCGAIASVVVAVPAAPGAEVTAAMRESWDAAWGRFMAVVAAVVDRVQQG